MCPQRRRCRACDTHGLPTEATTYPHGYPQPCGKNGSSYFKAVEAYLCTLEATCPHISAVYPRLRRCAAERLGREPQREKGPPSGANPAAQGYHSAPWVTPKNVGT